MKDLFNLSLIVDCSKYLFEGLDCLKYLKVKSNNLDFFISLYLKQLN